LLPKAPIATLKLKDFLGVNPRPFWVIKNHLNIYQTDEEPKKQGINELVKAILEKRYKETSDFWTGRIKGGEDHEATRPSSPME